MNLLGDFFDQDRGQRQNSEENIEFKYEKSEIENCNVKSLRVETKPVDSESKKQKPVRTPQNKGNFDLALKKLGEKEESGEI